MLDRHSTVLFVCSDPRRHLETVVSWIEAFVVIKSKKEQHRLRYF